MMFAEGADIPLTIVKSDGGFTYDTSDMACMRHRIEEEHGQWLIYVTDAGQSQHFKVSHERWQIPLSMLIYIPCIMFVLFVCKVSLFISICRESTYFSKNHVL